MSVRGIVGLEESTILIARRSSSVKPIQQSTRQREKGNRTLYRELYLGRKQTGYSWGYPRPDPWTV